MVGGMGGLVVESGVGILKIVPGGRSSYCCIYACVLHVLVYVERRG